MVSRSLEKPIPIPDEYIKTTNLGYRHTATPMMTMMIADMFDNYFYLSQLDPVQCQTAIVDLFRVRVTIAFPDYHCPSNRKFRLFWPVGDVGENCFRLISIDFGILRFILPYCFRPCNNRHRRPRVRMSRSECDRRYRNQSYQFHDRLMPKCTVYGFWKYRPLWIFHCNLEKTRVS